MDNRFQLAFSEKAEPNFNLEQKERLLAELRINIPLDSFSRYDEDCDENSDGYFLLFDYDNQQYCMIPMIEGNLWIYYILCPEEMLDEDDIDNETEFSINWKSSNGNGNV